MAHPKTTREAVERQPLNPTTRAYGCPRDELDISRSGYARVLREYRADGARHSRRVGR
jgi:hypothetical protein